ncbi:MAG: hypothetical protein JW827_05800 [Spirochaetes bacterium]|nr:hypothetical protein [Spirochaetota bacterium]
MKRTTLLLAIVLFSSTLLSENIRYAPAMFIKPFFKGLGMYRVTEQELKFYLNIKVKQPMDIAVTKLETQEIYTLSSYATERDLGLVAYNPNLAFVFLYGQEKFHEKFNAPLGIDASENGSVWVADSENKRIVVLSNNGYKLEYKKHITLEGKPFDITHDLSGHLYVSLYDTDRVMLLEDGKVITQITDHIERPKGLKFIDKNDPYNYFKSDFLALVNRDGEQIVTISEGTIKHQIDLKKFFRIPVRINFISIDYFSHILATDEENSCIHKFDRDLNYIASFNHTEEDSSLYKVQGIDVYKKYGQLFMVEKTGGRYYWMGMDVIEWEAEYTNKELIIKYRFTDPAFFTLHLYSSEGEMIRTVFEKKRLDQCRGSIKLKIEIEPGEYILRGKVEPTYSSYKRFQREIKQKLFVD